MLRLVKIEPNSLLFTYASSDSRVPEVSHEGSLGHFPSQNRRAAGDWTVERPWKYISSDREGRYFQGVREESRVLHDNILIMVPSFSIAEEEVAQRVTPRHALTGIIRHGCEGGGWVGCSEEH